MTCRNLSADAGTGFNKREQTGSGAAKQSMNQQWNRIGTGPNRTLNYVQICPYLCTQTCQIRAIVRARYVPERTQIRAIMSKYMP